MADSNFKYQGTDLDALLVPKSAVWQPGERRTLWSFTSATESSGTGAQVGTAINWDQIDVSASNGNAARYMGIRTDGTLWTWGTGSNEGQLGLNSTSTVSTPTQVGTLTNWKTVCTGEGSRHSAAIKTDGTLWTWGYNYYGMLGIGTNGNSSNRSSPVQVGSLTNWKLVSCGDAHTVAVKTDGTLWAWGYQESVGTLGLGGAGKYSSPVQVGSLTDWSIVTAGSQHTLAIKTDGTLWGWGWNQYGTVGKPGGDSGGSAYRSPQQIGSLTNWKQVSAGYIHSAAVKTDGTLWTWGRNYYGELGLGNTTDIASPAQVGALTNWSLVDAGYNSTMAIKTDGTLWMWGLTGAGNRSSPVQVGTLSSWVAVSREDRVALAIFTP